jgi:hypothetical protein
MIGDWQDEWDLKRRGSDRSINRHDICRGAAYLNQSLQRNCPRVARSEPQPLEQPASPASR